MTYMRIGRAAKSPAHILIESFSVTSNAIASPIVCVVVVAMSTYTATCDVFLTSDNPATIRDNAADMKRNTRDA